MIKKVGPVYKTNSLWQTI